jgi:hypothetical protein
MENTARVQKTTKWGVNKHVVTCCRRHGKRKIFIFKTRSAIVCLLVITREDSQGDGLRSIACHPKHKKKPSWFALLFTLKWDGEKLGYELWFSRHILRVWVARKSVYFYRVYLFLISIVRYESENSGKTVLHPIINRRKKASSDFGCSWQQNEHNKFSQRGELK